MRNFARLAAVLTIALLASPVFADIAPPLQFGQSLAPGEATKVAMTAEVVTITLLPEKALVRAVFHLTNTGDAEELLVGFPDTAPGSFYGTLSGARVEVGVRLKEFHARVDGAPVEHRSHLPDEEGGGVDVPGPDPAPFEGWITWDMTFTAGQKRTVEVDYWVPYRPRYRSTLLGDRDFTYVLKTGTAWHGPIGKATIVVRFGEGVTRKHIADIKYPGFTENEDGLTWPLTDLVPEQDLHLSVRRYTNYAEAAHSYAERAAQYTKEGNANFADACRAAAAECLWRTESYEACLAACRGLIAREQTIGKEAGRERFRIKWSYRAPQEVWECWVVRCLVKLKRIEEARAEAPAAIARMRADLKERKRYRHGHLEEVEARIARYEAFAAGGEFED